MSRYVGFNIVTVDFLAWTEFTDEQCSVAAETLFGDADTDGDGELSFSDIFRAILLSIEMHFPDHHRYYYGYYFADELAYQIYILAGKPTSLPVEGMQTHFCA